MPYLWCGRATGLPYRAGLRCGYAASAKRWILQRSNIEEKDLDYLNQCLQAIGQPAILKNIPDNAKW